jgi:hypothetical protein
MRQRTTVLMAHAGWSILPPGTPLPVYRVLLTLFCFAALLAVPRALAAQVVRGQLLAAEDNGGIRGAFVVLVDTTGRERAAALTDEEGLVRIQAPEPGVYRLRWELVGRPIGQSDLITLAAGAETFHRIVSFTRSLVLGAVEIASASGCSRDPDAEQIAAYWVEVTKALRVSQWSVDDDRLLFDVETVRRYWDDKFQKVGFEERNVFDGVRGRPFTTMPPEFLAEYGYFMYVGLQQRYFAPDEKALLHDSFLEQHCFFLAKGESTSGPLIGIGFNPAPDRNFPDISGVFWLHRDSLLLRAIDYRYTGMLQFEMHPSLGGRMEFDRLPSGEWYVSKWSIRMPVMNFCRGTGLFGFLAPRNRPCLQNIIESAGKVLRVRGFVPERRQGWRPDL